MKHKWQPVCQALSRQVVSNRYQSGASVCQDSVARLTIQRARSEQMERRQKGHKPNFGRTLTWLKNKLLRQNHSLDHLSKVLGIPDRFACHCRRSGSHRQRDPHEPVSTGELPVWGRAAAKRSHHQVSQDVPNCRGEGEENLMEGAGVGAAEEGMAGQRKAR